MLGFGACLLACLLACFVPPYKCKTCFDCHSAVKLDAKQQLDNLRAVRTKHQI